jgi:uncharacterized protein (TIGR02246 family)
MAHDPPAAVALAFIDRINARDLDGLTELLTEDHLFIDYRGNEERGRDLIREGWAGYFNAYPDYRIHVDEVLTSGDGVAIRGRTTGSHVPADVEADEVVVWTADIDHGKVAEWRIYAGDATQQAG